MGPRPTESASGPSAPTSSADDTSRFQVLACIRAPAARWSPRSTAAEASPTAASPGAARAMKPGCTDGGIISLTCPNRAPAPIAAPAMRGSAPPALGNSTANRAAHAFASGAQAGAPRSARSAAAASVCPTTHSGAARWAGSQSGASPISCSRSAARTAQWSGGRSGDAGGHAEAGAGASATSAVSTAMAKRTMARNHGRGAGVEDHTWPSWRRRAEGRVGELRGGRVDADLVFVPLEIAHVERSEPRDAVGEHDRHDVRIVNLLASDLAGANEREKFEEDAPVLIQGRGRRAPGVERRQGLLNREGPPFHRLARQDYEELPTHLDTDAERRLLIRQFVEERAGSSMSRVSHDRGRYQDVGVEEDRVSGHRRRTGSRGGDRHRPSAFHPSATAARSCWAAVAGTGAALPRRAHEHALRASGRQAPGQGGGVLGHPVPSRELSIPRIQVPSRREAGRGVNQWGALAPIWTFVQPHGACYFSLMQQAPACLTAGSAPFAGAALEAVKARAFALRPPWSHEREGVLRDEAAILLDRLLTRVARSRGALDVAVGERLAALAVGDRVLRLGFSGIGDYGRERLGMSGRMAQELARLARELRDRPVLAEAVRNGEVSSRKAETVLAVARGEAEAAWVERARVETVRALKAAVAAAAGASPEEDERWENVWVELTQVQRETFDEAMALAGRVLGATAPVWQRMEALCTEFLGSHATEVGEEEGGLLRIRLEASWLEAAKQALEEETRRWAFLDELTPVEPVAAPGSEARHDPVRLDIELREAEAAWVERARVETVRGLKAAVAVAAKPLTLSVGSRSGP